MLISEAKNALDLSFEAQVMINGYGSVKPKNPAGIYRQGFDIDKEIQSFVQSYCVYDNFDDSDRYDFRCDHPDYVDASMRRLAFSCADHVSFDDFEDDVVFDALRHYYSDELQSQRPKLLSSLMLGYLEKRGVKELDVDTLDFIQKAAAQSPAGAGAKEAFSLAVAKLDGFFHSGKLKVASGRHM